MNTFVLKKKRGFTYEVAQWLRALDAHAEDPGLVLSTHMAAHDRL